jgi:AcrR family transcriptional regulator
VKKKVTTELAEMTRETVKATRLRDKEKTREELERAIFHVRNSGNKMSISAVAREAGVNPSLLHNTYPDIAENIRAQMGRAVRVKRDQNGENLRKARETIKGLRRQLRETEIDIAKIASLNLSLEHEAATLREVVAGKVIIFPR